MKPTVAMRQGAQFLPYHEAREWWLVDEWYWYQSAAQPSSVEHPIQLDELKALIQDRLDEITPELTGSTQTRRGQLFEMLADLTDEDGALTELDDLEDLFGDDSDL